MEIELCIASHDQWHHISGKGMCAVAENRTGNCARPKKTALK